MDCTMVNQAQDQLALLRDELEEIRSRLDRAQEVREQLEAINTIPPTGASITQTTAYEGVSYLVDYLEELYREWTQRIGELEMVVLRGS